MGTEKVKKVALEAAKTGEVEPLQKILDSGGDDRHYLLNDSGAIILMAEYECLNGLAILVGAGADVNCMRKNITTSSSLHFAAFYGNIEIARLLLAANAWVDIEDHESGTPLFDAVAFEGAGTNPLIDELIAAGANPNHQDINGRTPLHWAASDGFEESVSSLLKHGARIDITDRDGTLAEAASSNESIRRMIAAVRERGLLLREIECGVKAGSPVKRL